jgi:hypothetical protein
MSTEEIRAQSYVGFDSITQQIEHKLLKRGFQFNVIVVGELMFDGVRLLWFWAWGGLARCDVASSLPLECFPPPWRGVLDGPTYHVTSNGCYTFPFLHSCFSQFTKNPPPLSRLQSELMLTIHVTGQTGLGKSTLINTIFASHLIDSKGRFASDEPVRQTTEIQAVSHGMLFFPFSSWFLCLLLRYRHLMRVR